jgi:CRISPR-associated protein Cse2 (CRISPR_cse2)
MTDSVTDSLAIRLPREQLLGEMSRRIHSPKMSSGALASLRRGSRHDVARQAAFYSVLAEVPEDYLQDEALARWASIAQCMALAGGITHSSKTSDGTVLSSSGLSESRFARLLASHGNGLFDQLVLIARFLRSKDLRLTR